MGDRSGMRQPLDASPTPGPRGRAVTKGSKPARPREVALGRGGHLQDAEGLRDKHARSGSEPCQKAPLACRPTVRSKNMGHQLDLARNSVHDEHLAEVTEDHWV